eukprot:PhF_6_TR23281/c0_g4_i1/m.32791
MGNVEVHDDTRYGDDDDSILGDQDLRLRDEVRAVQRKNKALEKENEALREEGILQNQAIIQLRSHIQNLEVQIVEPKKALRRERQRKVDALQRLSKARLAASPQQEGRKKKGRASTKTHKKALVLYFLYLQNTGVFTHRLIWRTC